MLLVSQLSTRIFGSGILYSVGTGADAGVDGASTMQSATLVVIFACSVCTGVILQMFLIAASIGRDATLQAAEGGSTLCTLGPESSQGHGHLLSFSLHLTRSELEILRICLFWDTQAPGLTILVVAILPWKELLSRE